MKTKLKLTIALLILNTTIFSQTEKKVIPLMITPVYYYDSLSINTPDYQKELYALAVDNADSLVGVFQNRIDSVSIESLFVFSVRLYDIGKKDEAVFWFHTAKIRAGIFIKALDSEKVGGIGSLSFELKQLFIAFSQLAGEYINGYAGGDVDKWVETLKKVTNSVGDLKAFPQYPNVVFLGQEDFQKAKENRIEDYNKLITYLEENKKEFIKMRKKNDMDGKY